MLESVTQTYIQTLSKTEQQIYTQLDERERDAFRICRDLAMLPDPPRPPGSFYLGFNHLADRIGILPMEALRTMRHLQKYGLLALIKKGTRHTAGVPGKAGFYGWVI